MRRITWEIYTEYYEESYKGSTFLVQIDKKMTEWGKMWEAWLSADNCGIKDYMFGLDATEYNFDEFVAIVNNNFEDYADSYLEEYGE